MSARNKRSLPLVYSCSGCSSAAQLANSLAVRLDRAGHAEMSCIAGVGGGVRSLVRRAREGRPIVAIDGCHLRCVRACLAREGVSADAELVLTEAGVKKRYHTDFDRGDEERLYAELVTLADSMHGPADRPATTPQKQDRPALTDVNAEPEIQA